MNGDAEREKYLMHINLLYFDTPVIIDKVSKDGENEHHNTFMLADNDGTRVFFTYNALKNIAKAYGFDINVVAKMPKEDQWIYLQKLFADKNLFFILTYLKNKQGYKVLNAVLDNGNIKFKGKRGRKNGRK